MAGEPLGDAALDSLFRNARTQNDWTDDGISEESLRAIYDLMKMGPTAANGSPARIVFCHSADARARLAACASPGNHDKILEAPCTAIIGMDMEFHEKLPFLFPHTDARAWFNGNDAAIRESAFRNSSLQGAYLIMAARSLGFDAGPMSGFVKTRVDEEFWAGTKVETNFICSIGHGGGQKLFPRLPRLAFEDACRIA